VLPLASLRSSPVFMDTDYGRAISFGDGGGDTGERDLADSPAPSSLISLIVEQVNVIGAVFAFIVIMSISQVAVDGRTALCVRLPCGALI